MTEEQMVVLVQQLIESGALEQLPGPAGAGEKFLFYIPLILLSILSFRYFVVNGIVNKILAYQATRNELLTSILTEIKTLKTDNSEEKRRLADVLNIVGKRWDDRGT